jgi:hypothetical protein
MEGNRSGGEPFITGHIFASWSLLRTRQAFQLKSGDSDPWKLGKKGEIAEGVGGPVEQKIES